MNTQEVYVPAKGYEGFYEISNYGNIRSLARTVRRKDGVLRKVSQKQLVGNRSYDSIMLAKNGIHSHESFIQLIMSSFYNEYDSVRHYNVKISNDESIPLLNRYAFFTRLQYNPVNIIYKDGNTNSYHNLEGFCKDHDIKEHTFMDRFFSGTCCHQNNPMQDSTIAFKHPVYFEHRVKIVSSIINVSKKEQLLNKRLLTTKFKTDKQSYILTRELTILEKDGIVITLKNTSAIKKYKLKGYKIIELNN